MKIKSLTDIIEKIFSESNYSDTQKELANGVKLYGNNDNKVEDYFLILCLEDKLSLQIIKDIIYKLSSQIKRLTFEFKGIEKNTSLIIFLKKDDIKRDENLEKQIYFLEEDPYFFKKQVFVYNQSQLEIITSNYHAKGLDCIMDYFTEVLYGENRFTTFKNINQQENEKNLEYEFISKFFIKMPFLELHVKKDSLENLSGEIDESLIEIDENLLILKDNLLKLVKDDMKELEVADILKIWELS